MNSIRLLLAMLIAFICASATATATATTKVTVAAHFIIASVIRAPYITVTTTTFAVHAPCFNPFVYPVPTNNGFGNDQVPSTAETIDYNLMSFGGRFSDPIPELKE